jgi:hypothetical protein
MILCTIRLLVLGNPNVVQLSSACASMHKQVKQMGNIGTLWHVLQLRQFFTFSLFYIDGGEYLRLKWEALDFFVISASYRKMTV